MNNAALAELLKDELSRWPKSKEVEVLFNRDELVAIVALLADVETVLRGFDEGVFVRDISHDIESGWAVKLLPYLAALGRLAKQCEPQHYADKA
jgi:hypothetical protein